MCFLSTDKILSIYLVRMVFAFLIWIVFMCKRVQWFLQDSFPELDLIHKRRCSYETPSQKCYVISQSCQQSAYVVLYSLALFIIQIFLGAWILYLQALHTRGENFFSSDDLSNILCKLFSAGLFEGIATISGNINFFIYK